MQRLSDHVNAADAASAPLVSTRRRLGTSVASTITSSGSRSRNHRRQDSDEETDGDELNITSIAVQPLVQSLQDLADSQRGLVLERALDRADRALNREHREMENSWKRRFQRHSFLVDEARSFRMNKIAELSSVDDDRSSRILHIRNLVYRVWRILEYE